jgi:hypothetical protein
MDKVIVTVLLVIAGVVASVMVINNTFPALTRSSNSIVRASQKLDERIETQISVVYATAERDSSGTWVDLDSDTYFDVTVWVKNVGASRILGADQADVFFGKAGDFVRVPHADDAGAGYPQWSYTLENGSEWESTVTAKISIHYESGSAPAADTYVVKIITPSGAYAEQYFSF